MLDRYIGIPFIDRGASYDGADCYGLIRLVYSEVLSIDIPKFTGSCDDSRAIWKDYLRQISEHWYLVTEYKEYDVIAMAYDPRHPKIVTHFGMYIGNDKMIHTLQGIGSFICDIRDFSYCIKGVYRWK